MTDRIDEPSVGGAGMVERVAQRSTVSFVGLIGFGLGLAGASVSAGQLGLLNDYTAAFGHGFGTAVIVAATVVRVAANRHRAMIDAALHNDTREGG